MRYLLLGFVIFFGDAITKYLTKSYLPLMNSSLYPYGGIRVFQDFLGIEFSLTHAINYGAAWGMFADFQPYLLGLRIVLVLSLLAYLLFFNGEKKLTAPLTLIAAGALSNVCDFFLYGHVVDMLHFVLWGYDFPVFNLADSAISIGVFWVFILSFYDRQEPVKEK